MMKQQYLYPGNGPPCPTVCNKGDPGVMEESRGEPSKWINAGGNFTLLPPKSKDTIKSCFLTSFITMDDVRNINCPKKLNGRGVSWSMGKGKEHG